MSNGKRNYKLNKYHSSVYFPENFPDMILEFIDTFKDDIDLTNHAAEQMYEDKRGRIPLPTQAELLDPSNKVFEFHERQDRLGRIQKAHFRVGHLSEDYDYTYVVARDGVIVTAWCNDKGDNHRLTESYDQYYCPEDLKEEIYKKLNRIQEKHKNTNR